MRSASGITIIELVIGLSLASFVLLGVAGIAAQMARNQADGVRSGTLTGWSVLSYLAMSREIEDGNVLAYPINDGDTADSIIICKNWSRMMGSLPAGGRLDSAAPVAVVQYCVDGSDPENVRLRRFANVGAAVACPRPGVPVPCIATPSGTWTETGVVGFRLEKLNTFPTVFWRDNSIGGVRLRYAIGQQAATAKQPVPKFTAFNFGIVMQKQPSNALD